VEDRRYVVCLNEEERRKDAHDRQAIVARLREQLRSGDKSLVGNKGYRRYLKLEGSGHFVIDEKQVIRKNIKPSVPPTRSGRNFALHRSVFPRRSLEHFDFNVDVPALLSLRGYEAFRCFFAYSSFLMSKGFRCSCRGERICTTFSKSFLAHADSDFSRACFNSISNQ
jgi:hypothetical protein